MKVEQVMTQEVASCGPHDSLNTAARLMWENDCGCVPVVGDGGQVVGVVTDRDTCMAAYTQGKPLSEIEVASAMSSGVFSCSPSDTIAFAEKLLQEKQVRRLPVVDAEGHLVGILSLNDIAREAVREQVSKTKKEVSADEILITLGGVCAPRSQRGVLATAA